MLGLITVRLSCFPYRAALGGTQPTVGFFEIFVYPVSAVIKLWHLLFHNALGIDASTAWVLSLVGLVVTVRALIAPFSFMQIRAGRLAILMRPERKRLADDYAENRSHDALVEYRAKEKELKEKYEFNAAAGCLPIFIQLPVFIGLYRVLLRMARPIEGADAAQHPSIGLLSSDDVSSFLAARVNDIPLPAYRGLGEERLAAMGTTPEAVHSFITPFILVACGFAFFNLLWSSYRNRNSLEYTSAFARGIHKLTYIMMIVAPLMLAIIGFTGPIPIAIAMYWVAGNVFSFLQAAMIYFLIWRKYPYTEEHWENQRLLKETASQKLQEKRKLRSLKRRSLFNADARTQRDEMLALQRQEKAQRAEDRAEAQAIQREYYAKQREERRAQRAKAKGAKSSNQPAEQTEAAPPDREQSAKNHSSDSGDHQQDHRPGKSTAAEPE